MTPSLKLTYFDLPARGDPTRLALTIGKIPFEDNRVQFADWPAIKPTMPLGSVPLLEVDGKPLVQSNAILRYAGRLSGLYPVDDAWKSAVIDEIIDSTADLFAAVGRYSGTSEEETIASRVKFGKEDVPRYWGGIEKRVKGISEDGPFIFGDEPTIADLAICMVYNIFAVKKFFAHVPTEAFDDFPRLNQVRDAVMEIPEVKEYYQKHPIV